MRRRRCFKTLRHHLKSYNGGVIYKQAVSRVHNGKWNPRKPGEVERLQHDLQTFILMKAQSLREDLIAQHQADVQDGFVKASKDTLNIISHNIDEVFSKVEIELEILEDQEDVSIELQMEIDARRALISNFKRFKTVFMEAISGAILAVIVGSMLTFPSRCLWYCGASGGAVAKGIYAYTDLRDTERSNLERLVDLQLAGFLKDVETSMRDNLDDYISASRDQVQKRLSEEIVILLSTELSDELSMFDKLLSAPAEELATSISDRQNAIDDLKDLLATVRVVAEEAPESISEEVPAKEAPESGPEETPAEGDTCVTH